MAEELEKSFRNRFSQHWQMFSSHEVLRYMLHEFILELLTAIHYNNYTDRRKKLDELLMSHLWKDSETRFLKNRFRQVIRWMRNIFNDQMFVNTRFRNKSDFYTLFVVLNNLIEKKYVISNTKDNKILGNTLLEFSKAAQEISSELKTYNIDKSWKGHNKELLQYVIATRQSTDAIRNRQFRNDYIHSLLKGFIQKRKDDRRIFDENIKGVLWTRLLQRYKVPKCPNPSGNGECLKVLSYQDAQIDHIRPWSKGGKTKLNNAQLICSSCNKRKAAK
jgi:hypothetical protein